jgi:integrase/recombinase XerD
MTVLRQRFLHDLQLRNYAPRTIQSYLAAVVRLAKHFRTSPDQLSAEQLRAFQLHLLEQKVSWSLFNQTAAALRFFYAVTLGRPDFVPHLPYGKKTRSLPVVLSLDEVGRLLDALPGQRDRLLLGLTYACGLRVSEVVRLKVEDIDGPRRLLHLRHTKGSKDRLVPLSQRLLHQLRDYWRSHRPRPWLFPGAHGDSPLSIAAAQKVCGRAVRAAGLTKRVSMHTLRHSYATHLFEAGVDLLTVQKLLGHRHFSTTARYIRLSSRHVQQQPCPLDLLPPSATHGGVHAGMPDCPDGGRSDPVASGRVFGALRRDPDPTAAAGLA